MTREELLGVVKNVKWNVQGFNAYPLHLCTVGNETGPMVKEMLGVGYKHFFIVFQKGRAYYHYDETDWETISDAYFANIHSTDELRRYMQIYAERYAAIRAEVASHPTARTLEEQVATVQSQIKRLTGSIGFSHAIEGITFGAEKKLRDMLAEKGASDEVLLSKLCSPTVPSFLWRAQNALWRIKHAPLQEKTPLAKEFLSEFAWIENTYQGSAKLTVQDVLERAANLEHEPSAHEFEAIVREKEAVMKSLSFSEAERFVVETIDLCFAWQDDRKMHILQSIEELDKSVDRLATEPKVAPADLKYMLPEEMTLENLRSTEFLTKLSSRKMGIAVFSAEHDYSVFSGADFDYIAKEMHVAVETEVKELRGVIASKGKVQGIVRVCESVSDIARVQRGEILVASMTRPEYLPAMQRAAAFITDEGGITSHAAIVSRELKKPCIIGTKIATKILKDGDIVEVDADSGVVRIVSPIAAATAKQVE